MQRHLQGKPSRSSFMLRVVGSFKQNTEEDHDPGKTVSLSANFKF